MFSASYEGRPIIAGNWKMNLNPQQVERLVRSLIEADQSNRLSMLDLIVFPSSVYWQTVQMLLGGSTIQMGAQNVSSEPSGAFTGEVCCDMLKAFSGQAVLVGHSERRKFFSETEESILKKTKAVLAAQLTPYICVGETQQERQNNKTEQVISDQLSHILTLSEDELARCVFAYEPVWAIGAGQTAKPDEVQFVHQMIRNRLSGRYSGLANKVPILYGGSVQSDNAGDLFIQKAVDGFLVGGASLRATDFLAICDQVR